MTRCGGTNPGQEKHQEFAGEWRCDFPPNISKYGDNIPIGSMYGIYANIGGILMVNVIIYSIHGSYGICNFIGFDPSPFSKVCKLTAGDHCDILRSMLTVVRCSPRCDDGSASFGTPSFVEEMRI